ncbi:unnamed protein product [Cylindrotheca closterium]|uniref:Uncharacterized protein n=1 Tax=Cylindrotheca closterium TaxID=2856 RepID=A0AAD2PU78_9STRA|nr:unnamed protein product [Cylindrotheca closterium]
MTFAKQFILMQRVKDISARGTSKIAVPKAVEPLAASEKLEAALVTIADAIVEQENLLRGLALRIHHTARVAERLFKKGNTTMTVATMRKVKSIQQEYVHVLRVVNALKEYETYVQTGLLSTKHVPKDVDVIKSAQNTKASKYNDTEILSQVAAKQFFPIMDSAGAISYSRESPFSESDQPEANTVVTSAA